MKKLIFMFNKSSDSSITDETLEEKKQRLKSIIDVAVKEMEDDDAKIGIVDTNETL